MFQPLNPPCVLLALLTMALKDVMQGGSLDVELNPVATEV